MSNKKGIFISHSTNDHIFVIELAKRLKNDAENAGFKVWIDDWEIKVGDSITKKIKEGLKGSGFFIIVLSDNSINSDWVKKELNIALTRQINEKDIKILPIFLDIEPDEVSHKNPLLSDIFDIKGAKFSTNQEINENEYSKLIEPIKDTERAQLLSNFQHIFLEDINHLDLALNKNRPTRDDVDLVIEKIKKESYQNYFFKKVESISWFDILKTEGYFSPEKAPGSKETEKEGYFSFPYWNVLPYLERISEKAKLPGNEKYIGELLNIIKNVTEYHKNNDRRLDNFYTWQSFVKILVNIPNNKITEEIIGLISIWLDTEFNNTSVPIEILKNLLPKFLDSDDIYDLKKAEKIVDITTGIKPIYYTEQEKQKIKEFITIVDGYILNEKFLVQKKAIEVGEKCSGQIIYTLTDRIKQIIESEYPDKDYDLSYIWLKSLFENPKYSLPTKTIITLILRDIIIAKAKKDKKTTKDILRVFLQKYNRPLFKRLVLLVIGTEWDNYNDIFWEIIDKDINVELFNDPHYKPEIYVLLQKNVHKFSIKQKEKIKNVIENFLNSVEEEIPEIEFPDEKEKKKYIAYQKQGWYSAVKSDDYFKAFYEECRKITGVEEEISFKQPEARWGFGESPQTEEEIMKMSNKELALYLTAFKTVDFWKGPTVRGLAEAMKNTAASHPEKFTDDLKPYLKTGYLYISNILWGIAQAIKNKKEINWGSLFSFIRQYIEPDDYWEDKYKIKDNGDILDLSMEENHLSVIRAVNNIIKEGTRYKPYQFSEEYFKDAQEVLFLILDKLLPQKNKISDNPYQDNFLMNAANSLFGTITEALVNLLLKVAQIGQNTGNEQTVELGKKLINKYEKILKEEITEGYFWLGAYLVNFYYTDKEWTENQTKSIDTNHPYWEPFMSGYLLLSRQVDKDLYKLMHKNYLESIDYDFKAKETKEMLVHHICREYLNGIEEINNASSLFRKILDTWDRFLIGEVIRFFWIQRDYIVETPQKQNKEYNMARRRIIDFWRWVYKNKYENKNKLNQEDEEILSELSKLTVFLPAIDSENHKWLELSATYVANIEMSFFIEYLNKIKNNGNSVDYLGYIFFKISEKNIPTFKQEDIVSIVEFLYTKEKKEKADEICNTYAKRDSMFLRPIYDKYNK